MEYTIIDKKDLFEHLNIFTFVNEEEVELAIGEYIENKSGSLYWSDCMLAGELAREYIKNNSLSFNN